MRLDLLPDIGDDLDYDSSNEGLELFMDDDKPNEPELESSSSKKWLDAYMNCHYQLKYSLNSLTRIYEEKCILFTIETINIQLNYSNQLDFIIIESDKYDQAGLAYEIIGDSKQILLDRAQFLVGISTYLQNTKRRGINSLYHSLDSEVLLFPHQISH